MSTLFSINSYEHESVQHREEIRECLSCYQTIDPESYLTWELIEFCKIKCVSQYHKSLRSTCSTCLAIISGNDHGKYHMRLESSFILFCSYICFERYVKSVQICSFCEKTKSSPSTLTWISAKLFLNNVPRDMTFCSDQCFKNFVRVSKICPPEIPPGTKCTVCNTNNPVKIATNHDGDPKFFCGTRCQIAFNFVRIQMGSIECKMCGDYFTVTSHSIVNEGNAKISLCSKPCKNIFMLLKCEIVTCNWCQTKKSQYGMIRKYSKCVLENVSCCSNCYIKSEESSGLNLKCCSIQLQKVPCITEDDIISECNKLQGTALLKRTRICVMASKENAQRNVATMCSVSKVNKSTATELSYSNKSTQTDILSTKMILPVPIPVYVPTPMPMFSLPYPTVLPLPMPIPVPFFLPCTQNLLQKIVERLQEIKVSPNNACEAELLKIAELIAEEDQKDEINNGTEDDGIVLNPSYFCKSDIEETTENIDIENALSANTCEIMKYFEKDEPPMKLRKYCEAEEYKENNFEAHDNAVTNSPISYRIDMRLDHALGINAWKQWASKPLHSHKNLKFIKSEILEMTPEELSFALCLFVKELRKPNGEQYAPDTIYYLCLGIQYYLDINGRCDSIFFEQIYQKFIECLDEFAKKFCTLYDDESHFIVTRVEEEHLWETKQLGCWSPYTLLNTLVYFNTKYYCRSNVEEHMELSFFHIMKAHKKSKADNYFILRLYPRSKAEDKQVYEQYQNKDDPLRCPVKLYEFYLSKCPESVKNSPNMLYLMPEKYVISESPLWYSTTHLPKEYLSALINRVKMIKEINVALLTR